MRKLRDAEAACRRHVQTPDRGQPISLDESGDDYLYPKAFFRSIALPQSIKKAVLAAA